MCLAVRKAFETTWGPTTIYNRSGTHDRQIGVKSTQRTVVENVRVSRDMRRCKGSQRQSARCWKSRGHFVTIAMRLEWPFHENIPFVKKHLLWPSFEGSDQQHAAIAGPFWVPRRDESGSD